MLGHDKVAVLDGGFTLWQKQGYPVTTALPIIKPAAFRPYFQNELCLSTGEVIDVKCYNQDHTQVGKDHEPCALSCARRGNQMGILAPDGTVYLIASDYAKDNNKKLIEFVAKQVEAKGDVMEHDGQKTITVAAMTVAR